MQTDSNTPDEFGTASHTIDSAAEAIAGLLDPEPDTQKKDSEAVEAEDVKSEGDEEGAKEPDNAEEDTPDADPDDEDVTDEEHPEESRTPASIKLDDGTEITLEEAKKGYLRQSDYTRKAQSLAEERKQIEAFKTQLAPLEQQTKAALEQAWQILQANTPQKPSAALASEDPFEYQRQYAIWADWAEKAQIVHQQHAMLHQRQMQEQQEIQQKRIAEERQKLIEAMPELADPAKREKLQKDVLSILPEYGFSEQETMGWTDSRAIRLAIDAAKWRMLQKTKPKVMEKAKGAPPVQKPGARPSPDQQKAKVHSQKVHKLRQTGRLDDAAAAIADLL